MNIFDKRSDGLRSQANMVPPPNISLCWPDCLSFVRQISVLKRSSSLICRISNFSCVKQGIRTIALQQNSACFTPIYNKALAEELFAPKVNPFVKFKTGRLWTATRKRAITKEELRRIIGYSGLFESASSLYCGNPIGKCSPRVTR